ncbi:MAG: alpha/beta fold hydrolase [Acidobacteria bacterium]|nr:alpha/beta fold hydrolase [Acidobacteriota bacterium]
MKHDVNQAGDREIRNQARSLIHLVRQPQVSQSRPPLLLLLHGYGSNEQDLFSLTSYLDERLLIVSARAPIPLFPGGYGWFQIDFTPQGTRMHADEAEQSRLILLAFLDYLLEVYNADPQRVYLAGFSQGAMMSLHLAVTHPEKVAGVLAMSGRVLPEVLPKMAAPEAVAALPIFVSHGIYDDVLPIENGRATRAILENLPVALTYKEYPMAHEISLESLRDATAWLKQELDK